MRLILALWLLLQPALAFAGGPLPQYSGDWTGRGSYQSADQTGNLKCRLNFSERADETRITGRCASAEGSREISISLIPKDGGEIVTQPLLDTVAESGSGVESGINILAGRLEDGVLRLSGASMNETATVTLESLDGGKLHFRSDRTISGRHDWIDVILER